METSLLIRPHRQAGRGHDMPMTVFRPFPRQAGTTCSADVAKTYAIGEYIPFFTC